MTTIRMTILFGRIAALDREQLGIIITKPSIRGFSETLRYESVSDTFEIGFLRPSNSFFTIINIIHTTTEYSIKIL